MYVPDDLIGGMPPASLFWFDVSRDPVRRGADREQPVELPASGSSTRPLGRVVAASEERDTRTRLEDLEINAKIVAWSVAQSGRVARPVAE